jgi:transposase-like protein
MARFEGHNGKERYWQSIVRRWERSKQTVRAFCGEHGLSEPSFYAWRRTLAERVQLAVEAKPGVLPAFVPVRVAPNSAATSVLEVVAGSGRVVRVPPGFDAATLRSLLAVLEEAPPC